MGEEERLSEDETGEVTCAEAREIAARYNESHWHPRRGEGYERARYSIPADPRRDDDIRLAAFIDQAERDRAALAAKDEEIAALRRDRDEWHRVSNAMESARDAAWGREAALREVLGVRFGARQSGRPTVEMARRVVADLVEHEGYERRIAEAVGHDPERCDEWGDVLDRIAALRAERDSARAELSDADLDRATLREVERALDAHWHSSESVVSAAENVVHEWAESIYEAQQAESRARRAEADLARLRAREEQTTAVIEAARTATRCQEIPWSREGCGTCGTCWLRRALAALDATPEHARGPSEEDGSTAVLAASIALWERTDGCDPRWIRAVQADGAEDALHAWRDAVRAMIERARPGQRSDAAEREGEEVGRGE